MKKVSKNEKDFSSYFDYLLNVAVIHIKYGEVVRFNRMSKKEILENDDFKVLTPFITWIDTRQLNGKQRQSLLFTTLGQQYLVGGGFFVNPINIKLERSEGLIILKENMVKDGINILNVCL